MALRPRSVWPSGPMNSPSVIQKAAVVFASPLLKAAANSAVCRRTAAVTSFFTLSALSPADPERWEGGDSWAGARYRMPAVTTMVRPARAVARTQPLLLMAVLLWVTSSMPNSRLPQKPPTKAQAMPRRSVKRSHGGLRDSSHYRLSCLVVIHKMRAAKLYAYLDTPLLRHFYLQQRRKAIALRICGMDPSTDLNWVGVFLA